MRILFVTSNRLGDAVLSTGLLDHLVRAHPDALFTVACGPVAEGVFTRLPGLEQIIVVTKQPYGRHWLGLWGAVVGTRWDLVVDLRASILSWMVPTQWRAVLRRRPGHKTQEIAAVLGLDPPPPPVAWTGPEDEAEADRLGTEGLAGRAFRRSVPHPDRHALPRRDPGGDGRAGRDGARDGHPSAGRFAGCH
jgi:ADP-heptose:LPS heptosyltransferase